MQLTVTVELAVTTMTITFSDGTMHVINVNQCNDVIQTLKEIPTIDTKAVFNFPPPLSGELVSDYLPQVEQWLIELRMNDGRIVTIPMGFVSNQPTWVNTTAGAAAAAKAIGNYFFK